MSATIELPHVPTPPSRPAPSGVEVVASLDELHRLESAWRLLGSVAGGPIEQFDWVATCADTLRPGSQLQVLTVRRGPELLAMAPLVWERDGLSRRLRMLGVAEHHEPMDLLQRDQGALKKLVAHLTRWRRPVVFERMPAESKSVRILEAAFQGRGLVIRREQASYPFIQLDNTWGDPEKYLNAGRRSDLRRARRRAEKLGEVTSQVLTPSLAELEPLLDEALAVEGRSWKGRAGTAMACDPAEAGFCRRYARAACRQGILRICFLRIGERAVAMQIAMVQNAGFWLLKIGYDADYAACSPGMLLLRDTIAHACREKLNTYEFLGQAEPWIEVWTDKKRTCVSLRIYPWGVASAGALATDAARFLTARGAACLRKARARIRSSIKACVSPVMRLASRKYIAGDTLADAARVQRDLANRGLDSTIGFWDTETHTAREVADQYLAALDALSTTAHQNYLSIKLPSLRYTPELLQEVLRHARQVGRRVHFDAMAPDSADRTRAAVDEWLTSESGPQLGYTLPGRWRRSIDDARWAAEKGLAVRVVKGEWADPADPNRDPRRGYLEVIQQLAGRARHVAVASHDVELAREALGRLKAAGTDCALELLYGLPMRDSLQLARELHVPVRVYVPFGEAYMPYALSQARRKPRILWWLVKDLFVSLGSRLRFRSRGSENARAGLELE